MYKDLFIDRIIYRTTKNMGIINQNIGLSTQQITKFHCDLNRDVDCFNSSDLSGLGTGAMFFRSLFRRGGGRGQSSRLISSLIFRVWSMRAWWNSCAPLSYTGLAIH